MSYEDYRKKRRTDQKADRALILSGDAAHVDYEDTTPVWKQEVTDAQGRKRLHGAFSGGFSAGYYNTVGSAQGWQPATFVSSRSNRHKPTDNRALNYMDDEDLEEIEADRQLQLRKARDLEEAQNTVFDAHASTQHALQQKALILPAKLEPRLAAATGGSKALNLYDDDDDLDAFDIGPKIKYDSDLRKRKKSANGIRHVFQSKKIIKIPAPEPELLRDRSESPERASTPVPQRLLPSIGDDVGFVNPDRASLVPGGLISQAKDQSPVKIPPWRQAPTSYRPNPIGKDTAKAALESTFSPYPTDPAKHARYRDYLEMEAGHMDSIGGIAQTHIRDIDMDEDAWRAELSEFRKAGLMYQPLTGSLSDKFTSSLTQDEQVPAATESLQVRAAKAGKFGHLTRIVTDFAPNRLLLKRFDIDVNKHATTNESREYRKNIDHKAEMKADMQDHKRDVDNMMERAKKNASKFV